MQDAGLKTLTGACYRWTQNEAYAYVLTTTLTVEGREPVVYSYDVRGDEVIGSTDPHGQSTVMGLFHHAGQALMLDDAAEATFDANRGYPTSLVWEVTPGVLAQVEIAVQPLWEETIEM